MLRMYVENVLLSVALPAALSLVANISSHYNSDHTVAVHAACVYQHACMDSSHVLLCFGKGYVMESHCLTANHSTRVRYCVHRAAANHVLVTVCYTTLHSH